jgi:hypothetical protein
VIFDFVKQVIIIIIDKAAIFRKFCQIYLELEYPVFTSLDFATTIFFTEQGRQPCVQPATW